MAILRKVSQNLKKVLVKKRPAARRQIHLKQSKTSGEDKSQALGVRETAVEQAKFFVPEGPKSVTRRLAPELPFSYGRDRITLQVRDPWWLHSYWEVTAHTWERLKTELGHSFASAKRLLRVYDITNIIFNGTNANRFFDVELAADAHNWYIDTQTPGRTWCVDLGLLLSDGRFITIIRSNIVSTPLDGPSWITDEEWLVPDDMFNRLYGLGFGFGKSSPLGKEWMRRIWSSGGLASMASPVKPVLKEKGFWLTVNTELIVYGATEPDAQVSLQGRPIRLRPDGTFTLRFALPDGRQVIPVKAVSADGQDERTVTQIVSRETR